MARDVEKPSPTDWQIPLIGYTEEERDFWDRVVSKTEDGALDGAARIEARREMERPENARLILKYGDIGARLARWICVRTFNKVDGRSVAMYRKVQSIAAELAGPSPSAVEALLAELAAIAWADFFRCSFNRETLAETSPSIRKATYYDQRVDRAHKRLVRSLRALAAVRKVDLAAIQVNLNGVLDRIPADGPRSRRRLNT